MTSTAIDLYSTATEMLRALQERRLSPVELLELHLRRIEEFNPRLNAIVTPDFDAARQAAREADAALQMDADVSQGRHTGLPLRGLPITIKDSIDVQGLPSTAGLPDRAETRAGADAPIVRRLRDAGAVIMGKTNVPPLTGDWQCSNHLFGRTNNPWDLSRTPGGSTGGGGAAVAAGLTPLEFGSDLAGSIRIPAAFCGVYGHKPSETAIPRSGHFPGSPLPNAAESMTVQGPLARSAEDLDLALGIIAGPDTGEDVAWRIDLPAPRHEHLRDYRIAVLPSIDWLPLDTEIAGALDTLAERLSRAGATVQVAQPDAFGDLREYIELYFSLMTIMTFADSPDPVRRRLVEQMRKRGDHLAGARVRGIEANVAEYLAWHGLREAYRESYRRFFREWDVLLAPVTVVPAFPHDDRPWSQRAIEINGKPELYELLAVYSAVATLCGQPATAFPVSRTRGGLPIGFQAIGPYLEDRTPVRFAGLVARECGGFQPPPGR
jgi:amidase